MSARDDREERLERLTARALGELPRRRAPATLEGRVLRAIGRQAPLPWWRTGFAAWPLTARAATIVICCGSAAFVLLVLSRLAAIAPQMAGRHLSAIDSGLAIASRLGELRDAIAAAAAAIGLAGHLVRLIPPEWLLGGLLAGALLYAVLFVLIAVGYRTLYLTPEDPGIRPS